MLKQLLKLLLNSAVGSNRYPGLASPTQFNCFRSFIECYTKFKGSKEAGHLTKLSFLFKLYSLKISKLGGLGVRNRIVDDSDSKPSNFEQQFNDNLNLRSIKRSKKSIKRLKMLNLIKFN